MSGSGGGTGGSVTIGDPGERLPVRVGSLQNSHGLKWYHTRPRSTKNEKRNNQSRRRELGESSIMNPLHSTTG
eukprot:6613057-Prorocentrum_lima.AAC.1